MKSYYTIFKEFSTFQGLKTESNLEKVLQKVNGTKLSAEDFLSEAEALLRTMPGKH